MTRKQKVYIAFASIFIAPIVGMLIPPLDGTLVIGFVIMSAFFYLIYIGIVTLIEKGKNGIKALTNKEPIPYSANDHLVVNFSLKDGKIATEVAHVEANLSFPRREEYDSYDDYSKRYIECVQLLHP
jgi:hypothetical protein